MMQAMKNRSAAVAIAVVIIVLATLFGVHRSINSETADIEKQFDEGIYLRVEKYVQPGIGTHLDERSRAALALVTFGTQLGDIGGMPKLTDDLRQARLDLVEAKDIGEKYAANAEMQKAYVALREAMRKLELSRDMSAAVDSLVSTMDGAQGAIEKSGYNEVVGNFRRQLESFPVGILKKLAFVKLPEYFGAEG